jgi:hypothetical protein
LGIDKASAGALIELTNEELRAKSLVTASRVRELCIAYGRRKDEIALQVESGKISKKGAWEREQTVAREISDEFDRGLRSDFANLNNELWRRLDPKVAASVVMGPILHDANTGTPIAMSSLPFHAMGIEATLLCTYADQIEQLAKLLPASKAGK